MAVDVVLVGRDLNARVRLEAAGARVRVADPGALAGVLSSGPADVLVADLDAGGSALLDELAGLRTEGILPERVVGYYSHVDTALGQAAEAAGVQAMARGQFWTSLSEVLGS